MTRRAGSADLPLHGGHVPRWLADRMTRLGAVMSEAIVHHYRYRYYVSHAILQKRKAEAGSVARVPAAEIEKLVLDGVRGQCVSIGATEEPTAIADHDLIERHVHSVTVGPQALEVRLVLDIGFNSGAQPQRSDHTLHVLAYNLTRVMNIIGVKPLMAAMRA